MLQRRHCQRAASNDAPRLPFVVVVPSLHRADAWLAIDIADHARPRCRGPRHVAHMRRLCRSTSRDVRGTKGSVHRGIVKIVDRRQVPGRDLLRSIELRRRVTTATPFGAHDRREGKEPWERFELAARACVGQWVTSAPASLCGRFRVATAAVPNGIRGKPQATTGASMTAALQAHRRRRSRPNPDITLLCLTSAPH